MFGLPPLRYTVSGFSEPPVDPLNKFALEGEGGYEAYAYTFVDRGSAFFDNRERTGYINGIISDTRNIKTTTIKGNQYYFIDNVLKIASGNTNKVIIYRDGNIDIGGTRRSFPWIGANVNEIADIFCPSNYTANYKQLFLMKNGDLYEVDCAKKTTKLLLSKIDRILAKDPAHKCDILCAAYNGDIYQAWVEAPYVDSRGAGSSGESASGSVKIDGINSNDLAFVTLGDPPWSAMFCYKNDRQKMYKFTRPGNIASHRISGIGLTPYLTLSDPDEYYIHGMSNEFNCILMTNKNLYYYHDRSWTGNYDSSKVVPFTGGIRICTPTAYSMMIEAENGYYKADDGEDSGVPQDSAVYNMLYDPVLFPFYNNLKEYLVPFRTT